MWEMWHFNSKYLKCNSSEVLNKINNEETLLTGWRPFRKSLVLTLYNHSLTIFDTWLLIKSCRKHFLNNSILQWLQNKPQAIPRCKRCGKSNSPWDPSLVTQGSKTSRVKAMDVSLSAGQTWRSTLQNLWEAHPTIFSSVLF